MSYLVYECITWLFVSGKSSFGWIQLAQLVAHEEIALKVPPCVGGPLPILKSLDPPKKAVTYLPENSCDPRAAVFGIQDGSGKCLGGIFDKDSFIETLEGWAKTVGRGRAKLGVIPVGIVAVETQTMMQVISDSHERVVPQAGQVWFPDSATKTAQALQDFNHEEL